MPTVFKIAKSMYSYQIYWTALLIIQKQSVFFRNWYSSNV